jgi:hypothetical protein
MPAATLTLYNAVYQDIGRAVHNFNSNTYKLALTNTAPNVSTHAVRADITEISAGSGYSAGGPTIGNAAFSQASGVGKFTGDDVTITASGGAIGPFRYGVIYNDTASGDPLVGFLDYGSAVTLDDGESLLFDVNASNGYLQVAAG